MKKCEHVVIFGMDALGPYMPNAKTPNIDRIFGDGAVTNCAICPRPSASPEGWVSILTGAGLEGHGIYHPNYSYDSTRLQPTIFSLIRNAMPDAVMGSLCDWYDINDYFVEEGIGVFKKNTRELDIVATACDFLTKEKPTLLFTYFEAPDDMGHTYGWGTVPYYDSIERCDRHIGLMYDTAVKAGMTKENTLFLIVSDHGGISYAHGCWHDYEKFVHMSVAGCGVENIDMGQIHICDAAAIVLYALGIPFPPRKEKGWIAQIPKGLFADGSGDNYTPVVTLHRNLPEKLPEDTTPIDFSAPNGLGGLFGEKAPILALSFDKKIEDNAGNYAPVQCYRDGEPIANRKYGGKGTRHWPNGVRGDCLLCDCDGYLAIPDLKPGENSFSASFWFYLDTALTIEQSCDVVFSNNTYEDRNSDGFYFRIGDSIVSLDICSDGVSAQLGGRVPRVAKIHRLPEEFDGGWMHVIVCFDREQRTYRAYLGFKEIGSAEIPEVFDGKSLDGCGTLRLGFQVDNITSRTNKYILDDFLWFDRALDEKDIATLYQYYYNDSIENLP